jgi:hypothetical protein
MAVWSSSYVTIVLKYGGLGMDSNFSLAPYEPHTQADRRTSRCGALRLLQKTLHSRGGQSETADTLNVKLWVLVRGGGRYYRFSGTAEPNPPFEYNIWTFDNASEGKFDSTSEEPASGISTRQLGSSEMVPLLRGQYAPWPRWAAKGQCASQGSSVTVHIEQYLLFSAAQTARCSSPALAASRLTSSMLSHVSLGASQLLKIASTTPRSYGRRNRSWHYEPQAQANC